LAQKPWRWCQPTSDFAMAMVDNSRAGTAPLAATARRFSTLTSGRPIRSSAAAAADTHAEDRPAFVQAEKDRAGIGAELARFVQRQQRAARPRPASSPARSRCTT
jgi:hypothetical protein